MGSEITASWLDDDTATEREALAAEVWESPDGSFGLSIEPRSGYIFFLIWGEAGPSMAKSVTTAVFAACQRHHCSRILCDVRNVKGRLGSLDAFNLVSDYRNVIGLAPILAAVLETPERLSHYDHFEAVADNRAWMTRVFSDRKAALTWLSGAPVQTTVS